MLGMKANVVWAALALLLTSGVHAQSKIEGVHELASAIATMTTPVWKGPRAAPPEPTPRPYPGGGLRSAIAPVAVHAAGSSDLKTLQSALRALEIAHTELSTRGWLPPATDAALGGGPEFDLYLVPGVSGSEGYADGLVIWSYLDRATTFAVVDPTVSASMLAACVTNAYAEALLLSLDPAESHAWREATAAWLTWEVTGRFGCREAVDEQQREPHRSWIAGGSGDGAGGALLLAFLSARHDGGSGRFVRDVWELASQRTWEGDGLRAEPDLWSAFNTAIGLSGDRLEDNIVDLAILRSIVGKDDRANGLGANLDERPSAPVSHRLKTLPARVTGDPPLQPFGSAYVALETTDVARPGTVRAWLEGEYGVRWSLAAVQLDEDDKELARVIAPPTDRSGRAYLPIELLEDASKVLFVITNLSSRLPDADEPDTNERAFQLVVARAE